MFSHDFLQMSLGAGMTLSVTMICAAAVFNKLCSALVDIIETTAECFEQGDK